jgi:hypothetical protein
MRNRPYLRGILANLARSKLLLGMKKNTPLLFFHLINKKIPDLNFLFFHQTILKVPATYVFRYLELFVYSQALCTTFEVYTAFEKGFLVKFKRNTVNGTVFIYLKPKSKDTNIMRSGCNSQI